MICLLYFIRKLASQLLLNQSFSPKNFFLLNLKYHSFLPLESNASQMIPHFSYSCVSLYRDSNACTTTIIAFPRSTCLDRDRPRDVSLASRGREYRRRCSVLVPRIGPRAAQSVFVRNCIRSPRVVTLHGRQKRRISHGTSINSACDIVLRIR